jgi:hypothetical protein
MTDAARCVLTDNPPNEAEDYAAEVRDNDGRKVVFWLKRIICESQHD